MSWRESGVLSSVIPVLTASIVMGWSLLSVTLGRWSSLGYFEGIIGGEFRTVTIPPSLAEIAQW